MGIAGKWGIAPQSRRGWLRDHRHDTPKHEVPAESIGQKFGNRGFAGPSMTPCAASHGGNSGSYRKSAARAGGRSSNLKFAREGSRGFYLTSYCVEGRPAPAKFD